MCVLQRKNQIPNGAKKNSSYDDDDDDNGRKMIHIYEREKQVGKKQMKNSIENSYFEFVI